jgi:hypothetical protein
MEIINNNPRIGYVYSKISGEDLIEKYLKVLIRGIYIKNKELLINIAGLKGYSAVRFNAGLN